MENESLYTDYEFFWKGSFSQWAKFSMTDIHGITFNCCEQYMMYKKAMLFGDDVIAAKILTALHPREQKDLGRQVKNFDQGAWDAVKYEVVYMANLYKFTQNPEVRVKLLETGTKTLVEASPYDPIWGIGLDEKAAKKIAPKDWPGQNLLGKVITSVRDIV